MGAPAAPTSVVLHRNSDAQVTLNWVRHPTTPNPYSNIAVHMRVFTGSVWGPYNVIANLPGTATSRVQIGLSANHVYQLGVRAYNSGGTSAYVDGNSIYMTPSAPSAVVSTLTGATIKTTWTVNAYNVSPVPTHTVQRSVNAGAWATVASGIPRNTAYWIDPSPGAGTNQYRVATVESQNGPLTSAFATGNVVSTPIAPLAPTQLYPFGEAFDVAAGITLSWQHNPGSDHSTQTHYSLEFSDDGGATWLARVVTNVASTSSTYVLAPGALPNGITYLWRVKTQGSTSAGFGPFSAPATIIASTRPSVAVDAVDPTRTMPLTVTWTYSQAEGSPQLAWYATLYAADGITILEEISGGGSAEEAVFAYAPTDGATYVIKVSVRSGMNLSSEPSSYTTTIDLIPPTTTHLDATFDECTGTTSLSLWADDPVDGVSLATEWVAVERRVAGGDWVMLARNVLLPNVLLDTIPLTNGASDYRVTSVSETPSYLVNPIVTVIGTDGSPGAGLWVFLAYGMGFEQVLRLHGDPAISVKSSATRDVHEFLGRPKPLLLSGVSTSLEVSVSGSLEFSAICPSTDDCRFDSPVQDWVDAGEQAQAVCYRDYTGRRIFGMLSPIAATDGSWPGHGAVSFSVTEADFLEVEGVAPAPLGMPDFIDGGDPLGTAEFLPVSVDGGTPPTFLTTAPASVSGGAP